MADKKEGRVLVPEAELREQFMKGAEAAFNAVATTYGPKGKNVAIERGFGRPTYTRDGVTVVEQVFFSDRIKNMGAQALAEASRAANNISGDGSSATVVLCYNLLKNGNQAVAAGVHPMVVSETIIKDSQILLKALKSEVTKVSDEKLKDVATVSAGDPLIGQLIAEAILYVGQDGGILTEKAPITEIQREYIDGYYLQSGFTALQAGKKELIDPYVIVSSKRLTSSADAVDILNAIAEIKISTNQKQVPRILFIGNFEDAAYTTIVNTINQGQIDAVIVKTPPMYGELAKYLLDDIALYANCNSITESTSLKDFDESYIGQVDKVIANKSEATVFASNDTEAVQTRIAEIKDQIAVEESPSVSEKLRDRVAKLEGKIAIFKIGGAVDTERERIEFQIEDAINSTRHAYATGIVPGGGTTLLRLSKLEISDITKKSLRETFQKLLENANLPVQLKLDEALKAKKGYGFNLLEGGELVDMVKSGIIDPYLVVNETILHATHMAAETIKLGMALIFEEAAKN